MNLVEWSNNEQLKSQLETALSNPALQIALDLIRDENMPSLVVSQIPGMTLADSIVADTAKKAGSQEMITKLRRLPFIKPIVKGGPASILGEAYEYLGDPKDKKFLAKQTKRKG